MRRIGEEGLCEQVPRAGSDGGQIGRALRREERNRTDTQPIEQVSELVFDNVGKGANDEQ